MYGSKRCLPAYTVFLKGDENLGKENNQNQDPNFRTLKSAGLENK